MDPNALLAELRELCTDNDLGDPVADEIAAKSRGGLLPDDWRNPESHL